VILSTPRRRSAAHTASSTAGWVVTGGAGWLWLAVLASAGVLLERCLERWL
jgi:hypothetical protein